MLVAVTGSSGLIGSALTLALEKRGHQVLRLVRRPASGPGEASWDPAGDLAEPARLENLDALVHLAGAGIADRRWSARRKSVIYDSRVSGTRHLVSALARLDQPPRRFLGGSAIGVYGNRGIEPLEEASAGGEGFLADLCLAWERETTAAAAFAERVYHLRTGIVLSSAGGALGKMMTPFKLGLGGVLGSGEQYMSWITIDDQVGAILHLLETDLGDSLESGPVNLTAPTPVTNREFTVALGRALGRPTLFPLPAFAIRTLFGEMGEEALLGSQYVLPRRLQDNRYRFAQTDIDRALAHLL
jgi:uncharacterized protein (TIGR01777 family)